VIVTAVSAQRRTQIQDLIARLRNTPRRESISPSFSSNRRQFDVIGTGRLPLQNHRETDFEDSAILEPGAGIRVRPPGLRETGKVFPGQFTRDTDRTYFQPSASAGLRTRNFQEQETRDQAFYYNQDPEMFDRWPVTQDARRRSKRSPYKRIKIKLPNPFYYDGKPVPVRRRVRVKQVIPASRPQPQYIDRVDRGQWDRGQFSGYEEEEDRGYLGHWEEDHPRPLQLLDANHLYQEPEPLSSDDSYESELSNEARELLGSGNYIIETGGTFYDNSEGRGYSDHRPRLARYPDTQAPGPAVDNFRDFADIKQERLFNIYRSKLRNRRIDEHNYY